MNEIQVVPAGPADTPDILKFIKLLADYEKLAHEVVATEDSLRATLFGERRVAEVVLAELNGKRVGFALFFHSYSTFLAKPGIYLEDLFVLPECRGHGVGQKLLSYLAALTIERDCGRLEWAVLDWNEPAIRLYKKLGAKPMDEWTTFRITGDSLSRLASGA